MRHIKQVRYTPDLFRWLALLVLGITVGCGSGDSSKAGSSGELTPRDVASTAVRARLDGDFALAYSLSSTADRAARDSVAYVASAPNTNAAMWRMARERSSFTLGEPAVSGDSATVPVTLEVVDTDALSQDFMAEVMSGRIGAESGEDEFESAFDRLYSGDPPMTTKRETVELVREAGGWRVLRGWDYGRHLEVSDVAFRSDYGMAFVTGTVRNGGPRDLVGLRGTAYFHGPDGRAINEQAVYLVNSAADSPLRSGYVKEFEAYVDDAPNSGVDSVSVVLDDFTFAE